MLQRGGDAIGEIVTLQTLDIRGGDRGDEIWLLAECLLDATPTGVTGHVGHGGQTLVCTDGPHLPPDDGRHVADELRIPSGREVERTGKRGRILRHQSGKALLVANGRYAKPCLLDQAPLEASTLSIPTEGSSGRLP